MSGQIIGGAIGIGLSFASGGLFTPAIGWLAGSVLGGLLFPPVVNGPSLGDLKPQASEFGRPLPIVYGTIVLGGNVTWQSADVIVKGDSGGKGGGTPTGDKAYGNFEVSICEGEVELGRIWAGPEKRLIYDGVLLEGADEGALLRFYPGSQTQLPDPLIESYEGVGNVEANRGTAKVVLEHFPLEKDGNRIPFLNIEVGNVTTRVCPAPASTIDGVAIFDPPPIKLSDSPALAYGRVFQDGLTGFIYYVYLAGASDWRLGRVDPATGDLGGSLALVTSVLEPQIAWDGNGGAQFIAQGSNVISTIDLAGWAITGTTSLNGLICNFGVCAAIPVPLWDVCFELDTGEYRYLSEFSLLNGTDVGISAIEPTDVCLARAGYDKTVNYGAVGVRGYGDLIQVGEFGVAADFPLQAANYATDVLVWDGYDSKRKMLVSFSSGAYATLADLGYVNTSDFALSVGPRGVVYSPAQDLFFVVADDGVRMYDPAKLTPEHWPPEDCIIFQKGYTQGYASGEVIPVDFRIQIFLLPEDPDYLGVVTGGGDIMKVYIRRRVTPTGVALSEVVYDLSIRAGLTAGQIDVTQLTDIVDGYAVANQTTVRDAISVLMPAYYFDAVESDGKVKFVKRGGAIAVVIPDEDVGCFEAGSQPPDPLETTRRMENELPRTMNVRYLLEATNYSTAVKAARRLVGASGEESTMELPLVLSDAKAQEIAEVNLHGAWVARLTYSFTLPRKYSYLEPTDPIVVYGFTMRLTKTVNNDGIIKCEATHDDSNVYTPHVVVTETPPPSGGTDVATVSETILELA